MKEKWKKIKSYRGKYLISNNGKIFSVNKKRELKKWINNNGYELCSLCINGKTKSFLIHRLVAFAFIKEKIGKTFINHKDCNKINNKANNLEWCTHSDNMAHAYKNGRFKNKKYAKGEGCGQSRLNEEAVLLIRGSNMSTYELAKIFNVSQSTIWRALKGETWRHSNQ